LNFSTHPKYDVFLLNIYSMALTRKKKQIKMGKTELERPATGNRVIVKSCGNNSTEQLVTTAQNSW